MFWLSWQHSPNRRDDGEAARRRVRAFSSEVGTGSREENASKQESRASVLDLIRTEYALAKAKPAITNTIR